MSRFKLLTFGFSNTTDSFFHQFAPVHPNTESISVSRWCMNTALTWIIWVLSHFAIHTAQPTTTPRSLVKVSRSCTKVTSLPPGDSSGKEACSRPLGFTSKTTRSNLSYKIQYRDVWLLQNGGYHDICVTSQPSANQHQLKGTRGLALIYIQS